MEQEHGTYHRERAKRASGKFFSAFWLTQLKNPPYATEVPEDNMQWQPTERDTAEGFVIEKETCDGLYRKRQVKDGL